MNADLSVVEVVFFDAAGTLFHVRGSVGEIYSRVALKFGIETDPIEVEKAFSRAFRAKSAEGIQSERTAESALAEKRWWLDVVRQVFAGRMPEPVLHAYFDEVFEVFRGSEAWELYSDAEPTLQDLKSRGYRLGIISNFDSRLYDVLAGLGIRSLFEGITISWRAGASKPDARIFQSALRTMRVPADRALHIGDSPEEDVKGAVGAGIRALVVDRKRTRSNTQKNSGIGSLSELSSLLRKGK